MTVNITAEQLRKLYPHATAGRAEQVAKAAAENFETYQITTPLRVAHFFGQVGVESGELHYVEEIASGAAYEGRKDLGNTQPGDGPRFKGHGLIQTTGRTNHREVTEQLRARGYDCPDFEKTPKALAEFPWCFLSACEYWASRKLNALADADNGTRITEKVNGGHNHLAERLAYAKKGKPIFANVTVTPGTSPVPAPVPAPKPLPEAPAPAPKQTQPTSKTQPAPQRPLPAPAPAPAPTTLVSMLMALLKAIFGKK